MHINFLDCLVRLVCSVLLAGICMVCTVRFDLLVRFGLFRLF